MREAKTYCNLRPILERATGIEPATLGLGNLSGFNNFNDLAYLAYQTEAKCIKMSSVSAPYLHPNFVDRKTGRGDKC